MGILRKLKYSMMAFGFAMGLVFPFYARVFVVFKPDMHWWFDAGCIIAGVVVGMVSYGLVRMILLKDILKLAGLFREVAEGNINVACKIQSADEMGEISAGFNDMACSIKAMTSDLNENVMRLSEMSSVLNRAANNQKETITQEMLNLAHIASASAEATATQLEVTRNVMETAEFSREVTEKAQSTIDMLSDTMISAEESEDAMVGTIDSMKQLERQSHEIEAILSLIGDIADQTNLLALNAAIEAARAGDQGRGFAVVADEVKKLAEKTAHSTRQIGDLLTQFGRGVQGSIGSIQRLAETSRAHMGKVADSAKFVGEILADMRQSSARIDAIHTAASEQSVAFEEISSAMESMTTSFREVTKAAETVVNEVQDINRLVVRQIAKLDRFGGLEDA